jgi:hypothetical protein
MKLNYYSYYINHVPTGEKFGQQIDGFLKAFCKYDNSSLKNEIKLNGKNLYLLNPVGNLFLFLQTSNADLIKKFNKKEISASDLHDILSTDESIAFASYVYHYKQCFGIASTVSAPKLPTFCHFVNQLLQLTGNNEYQFVIIPNLIKETTRKEALDLSFIGKATIEVGRNNTLFEHIKQFLGTKIIDTSDISSMQLIIKPKRNCNIKEPISKVLENTNDDDLQKFIINARNAASENLTEYYIEGKGIFHDIISPASDDMLASTIRNKMINNHELNERLSIQKNEINNSTIDSIRSFDNPDTWADFSSAL